MIECKSKWSPNLIWSTVILTHASLAIGSSSLPSPGPEEDSPVWEINLQIEGVGNGYSSPAVTEKLIYLTGETNSLGYIMAFDWEGNEIWKKCYGPEWTKSFRGSRAEPVVDQTRVYVCSGHGTLTCYDAASGRQIWNLDLINDLGGQNVNYGYSMPVLIDGDQMFCSPGGKENNIVALDKYSGDLLWSSAGVGESAGYGRSLVVNRGELKILMTFSEFTFLGLDARTGEILWTSDLNFKGELPCNQPVYSKGRIYIVAGPGNGAFAFDLSHDGKSIRESWRNPHLNSFFGGFELLEDYLVGSAEDIRSYVSVDTKTGGIKSKIRFGKGAITRANDLLITYNQKGHCGIMSINDGKLSLLHEFRISKGTGEHFAIPVFFKDMLIIRHGNTLLVYRIEQAGIKV
ncbi:MAG: PQQ-binding-like beta-propeller repeat protein [Bacteroidetes bacterium]|nr:PQQ-binding-like beta-propeller repeat protein [Bacteroidota bacterium]